MGEVKTTHGMSKYPEYRVWEGMRRRCRNLKDPHYGGRGIRVSEEWEDFTVFYKDMGPRPSKCDIDRIDNDGNYEKNNCRWVPRKLNCRNKSNNTLLGYDGTFKTLAEWSENLGISHSTLLERLEHWPLKEALTTGKTHATSTVSKRSRRVPTSGAKCRV
jgi:hypothetical protein